MNWPTVPLGSIVELDRNGAEPSALPLNTRYVGLEHIDSDGAVSGDATIGTAELKSTKFCFNEEHILYGKLRPYLRKIARPDFGGVCSTDIIPIRPTAAIDRGYLFYFLRSPEMVAIATSRCTGANLPRLNPNQLEAFEVPLPPLPEQKRIAAILDAADALRARRRDSIEQLDALVQATFLEMFGDPLTNPKAWEAMSIGDALGRGIIEEIQDGNHGEKHPKVADFTESGVPFVMANCFANGALDLANAHHLPESWLKRLRVGFAKPGDALITHKGTIGETAVAPDAIGLLILSPQVTYYRPSSRLCAHFLVRMFASESYQALLAIAAKQSTRAYIGITRQKRLPLIVPPIDVQRDFYTRVKTVEQQHARMKCHLAELDRLFAYLQSTAFEGKLI
jgi:type I restriction enzyme S subunit